MDRRALKSFILQVIKPLKSGKVVSQVRAKATLSDLFPEGSDDRFTLTSPFGFVSKIPAGVTAFYQELYGSGFEPIMLAALHALRPEPIGVGEAILYSTDSTGKTVKVKITLANDGKLSINAPLDVTVASGAKVNVTAASDITIGGGGTTTVSGTSKSILTAPQVELGTGGLEKVVSGETYMQFYNLHYHLDSFGLPTTPPMEPMTAQQLSSKVKAAK